VRFFKFQLQGLVMTTLLGYLKQVIRQELISMYIACRSRIMESPSYLENSLALAQPLALERLVFGSGTISLVL